MANLRIPALALAAVLGAGIIVGTAGAASAMPVTQLAPAAKQITEGAQGARWACGPYRCWWRPGPYWHGGYWGPHRWGWHHHYWHRWGWHHWGWRHHYWHRRYW
jgi:hypothetical protein